MYIDLESDQMSEEEAEAVLEAIYQMYHGRTADSKGRDSFIPKLRDQGFKGLVYVLNSVLNSTEMKKRTYEEMTSVWKEYLKREPTKEEFEKYEKQIRFFHQVAKEEIATQINRAESLRQQASPYLKSGELEKAQQILDEAVINEIAPWLVWHDHGVVRLWQGNDDALKAAIPSYHKAIAFNTDDNYVWSCEDLKWCYGNLGEKDPKWYEQGLSYFQSVIDSGHFPNRWIAWHECGWMLLRMQRPNEAIEYYLKEIELQTDQNWGWSYLDLLQCYRDQGQHDLAYDYFMSLVSDDSKNWGFWHSLGWLQWKHRGDPDAAIESYCHSTELHPEGGWFWTLFDLGWCYRESSISEPDKYHKAFHAFEKAKEKDLKNWQPWNLMGWAKEKLGDWDKGEWDKAIEYFQKALSLEPKSAWSWIDLARCYRSKSQPEYVNSWLAYQHILSLEPLDKDAYSEAKKGLEELDDEHWGELRKMLVDRFNLDEIRTLCFDLGIEYEELEGSTRTGRVISLIDYCKKRDKKLIKLIDLVKQARPELIAVSVPS